MKRRTLAGSLFLVLCLLLGSCTSFLGVDEYNDSVGDLCELVDACYNLPNCTSHVGDSLDSASGTQRTSWLVAFSDQGCLLKCTAARKCLNIEPVCDTVGQSCQVDEECCGFLSGQSACDLDQSRCCRPQGVPCTKSGPDDLVGDCCNSLLCDQNSGTCGGVICRGVGQFCRNDFDCCTNSCQGFVCAPNACVNDGAACDDETPCCSGVCGPSGRCACVPVGGVCAGDGDCCQTPTETICDPAPNGGGTVCQDAGGCFPDEFECQVDGDCCSQYCDPGRLVCGQPCLTAGKGCQANEECCTGQCGPDGLCACSPEICTTSTDCCSVTPGQNDGKCYGGACQPACVPAVCHDECESGPPLDPKTCTTGVNDPSCINAVCAADPYCCCSAWDQYCINETVAEPTCNGVSVCSL